ncbi:MAG: ArsR/SmtB family transcription factor [Hyphomicrobium sp.]
MQAQAAVTALSALAHPQRLAVFRALVREGSDGMTAGALASVIKASPAAASFHLKELDRAGLIYATRNGRFMRYALHVEGMRRLLTYLTEDCCQGQPELCGDAFKAKKSARVCKGVKNVC